MQASRTGDERYCNWVKDTLALLYLKEGLEVFVDQQSNAFHNQLKAAMGAHTCTCTWQALTRGKRTWKVKHCPSGTCQSWLGLILSHHSNRPFPQLTPENTDPALWPTDYWEVMKVYQPRGCRDQHSAKEADVAGILTILNNCDYFWTFITKLNDVNDLLQLRNRLMHSSDYLVETPDMTNDLQFMLQFLRGLKSLSPTVKQPVQIAIDKIEQLRANKLDLSLNRELELKTIRAKQVAMETGMGNLDQAIKDLGAETVADLGTVKAKLVADVQTLQQQLDSQLSLIKDVQIDMTTQQQASTDVHYILTHIQQQLDALEADLEKCKTDMAFIADMKQHLADLELSSRQQEGRMDTLYQRQQDTNTRLEAQMEEVQEQKEQLQTHTSELQAHRGQLQAHTSELQAHSGQLQTHTSELQAHRGQLQAHTGDLQAHHDQLQAHHGHLQTHTSELQAHHGQLQTHTSELQVHHGQLQTYTSELQAHHGQLHMHTGELQAHHGQLQTHTGELQAHHGQLQTHTGELQAHHGQLQTHYSELQVHHGQLQMQRAGLEDHGNMILTCQTDLQSHRNELVKHQSELQTHGTKLEDQDTRLLSCQAELQEQKEDLRSHRQKLTNLEERMESPKADNTSTEITEADIVDLRTSLIKRYRQHYLKVPNPIVVEEIGMKEVYVRPDIKVLRETKNPDSGLVNVQKRKAVENASMCKQLFYTDDYKNKQIYVTSDAGMGKTLFCKHLTSMWCSAHTDACSGYSEEEFQNDIEQNRYLAWKTNCRTESFSEKHKMEEGNCKILLDFRLLFYITLRDSMKQYSIAEMIDTQVLNYIKLRKKLKASDILEKVCCLVIIDGLDEWVCPEDADISPVTHQGIPGRLDSDSNTVYLTTTRPWKFDVLNLTSSDVDKHIEIVGLNRKSSVILFSKLNKLFSGCEIVDISQTSREDFMYELDAKDLIDLHTIPVLFTQLICLWLDKQQLAHSQMQLYCSMLEMLLKRPDKNLRNRKRPVFPKPVVTPSVLPDCFSNLPYCQANQHLLLSLCRVAFEALFNEKREDSLVIDSSQGKIFGLDAESVELCLNSGILSQNKVLGKWSVSEKKMSFLHKTVQEFLAAVFIAINETDKNVLSHVKSFCCTIEKVTEMSQVWMFLSGLRPLLSQRLLTDLMTCVVFIDEQLQQYRQTGTRHLFGVYPRVISIQTCIVDCVVEASRNGHHDFCLPLEDFFITHWTFSESLISLLKFNMARVKAVYLHARGLTKDNVDLILYPLQSTQCLQTLSLSIAFSGTLCETIVKINTYSSLTCLVLKNMTLTSESSAAVSGMVKHLKALYLFRVKLAHEDRELLVSSVSQACALRQLDLGLKCTEHDYECQSVPDLSDHTQLRSVSLSYASIEHLLVTNCVNVLSLWNITVPEVQLRQLLSNLSTASHRVTVELIRITVTGHIEKPVVLPMIRDEVSIVIANWDRLLSDGVSG